MNKFKPVKLCMNNLKHFRPEIKRPHYSRNCLQAGIVHIGVGNFHRAHMAWYTHRLMQQNKSMDFAIIGAGVRSYDVGMRNKLLTQDYLTTLIELNPTHHSVEIIGSMVDYLPIEKNYNLLIQTMAQENIRIVSLTVTEGGYYIDAVSKALDTDHKDICHDRQNPYHPKTIFGAIVAALKLRKEKGLLPFTCLSCDNLQGNGDIFRQTVLGIASFQDEALALWVDQNGAFPNSMVDCIVPMTQTREINYAYENGIDDSAPVTHEPFRQWVIEDKFCSGRPVWEDVGVTFSKDVKVYEKMKVRILNAGHQILANTGDVLSLETIADCMAHPLIAAFFEKVQQEEILETVTAVPNMTPGKYLDLVTKRFANPKIYDTTRRVAFDGASRHSIFVLPIIFDRINTNLPACGLALLEALWARMCQGIRENGSVIEANDPMWEELQQVAIQAKTEPLVWLKQSDIYDSTLLENDFAQSFCLWLKMINEKGIEASLTAYIEKK